MARAMGQPKERGGRLARNFAILAFSCVVLALVWYRSALLKPTGDQQIHYRPIEITDRDRAALSPFVLNFAWQLRGDPALVTGLSGLDVAGDGRLIAVGDRGSRLLMPLPGSGQRSAVGKIQPSDRPKDLGDTETVTVDPVTGNYWIAQETDNRIVRFAADGSRLGEVEPAAMAPWPENTGAEGFTRLADGRFLAVGELREKGGPFPLMLFAGDPLGGGEPIEAGLRMPERYKPVGLALLPDGRVLVLGRMVLFPLRFRTMIAVIDPSRIAPGQTLRATPIATIGAGNLADNFEGIAAAPVGPGPDGRARIKVWLVSDDNQQQILQSTKLLELEVDPAAF